MSRRTADVASEAMALVFGAELDAWEGKHAAAAQRYAEGIRVAREHGALMPALEGLFMAGVNLTAKGDYDAALAVLEEGLALAEKVGDANYTPRSLNSCNLDRLMPSPRSQPSTSFSSSSTISNRAR